MRIAATIMLTLLAGAAMAQPTPPPPGDFPPASENPLPEGPPGAMGPPGAPMPPPGPGQGGRMNARQRFTEANVTHDGRLTRDQARQARWMGVARHFDEIDLDRKGYITLQDLREWSRARRASRPQYQGAPPPSQGYQGAPPPQQDYQGAPFPPPQQ